MEKTIVSKQWSLQLRDFIKGAGLAVLAAVITPIIQTIGNGGVLTIDWPTIGNTAIIAFLGYIAKNWVEPTKEVTVKTPGS